MRKIVDLFIEMPVLNPDQQSLGNPSKVMSTGITQMEQTERRYKTCLNDWDSLGQETIYGGNVVEWFQDTTLQQVRGFLFTPQHEHMGLIAGAMPVLTKFPNFLGVHLVYLFKPYQGKGNGLALYQNAVEKFGGIVSDSSLTPASLGVWKSLSKKYPTYWYRFGKNPDHPGRILEPISGQDLTTMMGSSDEPFIMSKDELLED